MDPEWNPLQPFVLGVTLDVLPSFAGLTVFRWQEETLASPSGGNFGGGIERSWYFWSWVSFTAWCSVSFPLLHTYISPDASPWYQPHLCPLPPGIPLKRPSTQTRIKFASCPVMVTPHLQSEGLPSSVRIKWLPPVSLCYSKTVFPLSFGATISSQVFPIKTERH